MSQKERKYIRPKGKRELNRIIKHRESICSCKCLKAGTKIFKAGSKFMSELHDSQGKDGNVVGHEIHSPR